MPTNLYGPNDSYDLQTSHVLPALIRKAHEAKSRGDTEYIVWGSGTPMREFLYVDDLADACVHMMDAGLRRPAGQHRHRPGRDDPRACRDGDGRRRLCTGRIVFDASRSRMARPASCWTSVACMRWDGGTAIDLRQGIALGLPGLSSTRFAALSRAERSQQGRFRTLPAPAWTR